MNSRSTINAGNHNIIITSELGEIFSDVIGGADFDNASFFVIMDENTHKFCFPLLQPSLPEKAHKIVIGAGELNKNIHTCQVIWKNLLQAGADRNAIIINLGGGMVTDIGGFAAATYKRGIKFINIPTSLLGMVDASCGGKTGVDLDSFKNMVGVFAFPQTVIVDPVFLQTLPEKELKCGMAEVLKHALIADEDLWNKLLPILESQNIQDAILENAMMILHRSVVTKAEIVSKDPFEKNERKFLNFGHTIGHALETWSLKNDSHPISHGEAVGAGMICETYISEKLCGLSAGSRDQICRTIKNVFPINRIKKESMSELVHFVKADKKSDAGKVTFALLSSIGKPVLMNGVEEELLYESFHFYNVL